MNSLVITPISPPDPDRDLHGIYQRLRMFVGAIGQISKRVEVLHLVPEQFITPDLDAGRLGPRLSAHWGAAVTVTLAPIWRRRETAWNHYIAGIGSVFDQPLFYPFSGAEQTACVGRALARGPDLVFIHRLAAICPVLRGRFRPARMFFDLDDIEHRVRVRSALQPPLWPGKLLYAAHAPAILRAEMRAAALSRSTFVCSELDRGRLARAGLRRGVRVVPNAVAMPARATPVAAAQTLLFLGDYQYEPNQRAAERLVERIWPLVRAACPAAELIVAGRSPERLRCSGSIQGVQFPGFVADLPGLYARSRVVCCPLTVGGGTRLKLIEAAGYARAIVSTRIGAEGLDFRDGSEILLRDTDAAFAAGCVSLLEDIGACERLGAAARTSAIAAYDLPNIQTRIATMMRDEPGDAGRLLGPGADQPAGRPIE